MKKRSILLITFTVIIMMALADASQDNDLAEFNAKLKIFNLEFKMPDNFIPVKVDLKKCEDVDYLYAVKHKDKKLEVRYSVFPYQMTGDTKTNIDNDLSYKTFTYTVVLNIAGGEKNVLKAAPMDVKSAKEQFNADWGLTTIVNPLSVFGKDYKMGLIISLYKNSSPYAYITFLFDDFKEIKQEYLVSLHSLRYL